MYPNGLLSLSFSSGVMTLPIIPSYTKHYYAGSQRVASKIGTSSDIGLFNCGWLIIPFGGGSAPINEKATAKEKLDANTAASLALMQARGITPPVNYGQNAGYGEECVSSYSGTQEKEMYWFHANHLGSSSFITGIDGEVNQNIEYFPSGEVFVENHMNSYNTPYKFNGKELDSETGYYYYGARYYNPRTSLWLSVDPLAEVTPSFSPYAYTYNNPINFIDPTGMIGEDPKNPNPDSLWHRVTWSGARRNAQRSANSKSDIGYESQVYKNADVWSVRGQRTRDDGNTTTTSNFSASYDNNGEVYSKSWSFKTPSPESVPMDYISSGDATISSPSPFQGKSHFDIVMVDTNPLMPAIAGAVAPPLGFLSGSAQTVNDFSEGNYVGGSIGLLTLGASAKMSGGSYQWLRYGKSYSHAMDMETVGYRWGASPKYLNRIPHPTMQKFNQYLRGKTLPFGDKLQQADPGHYHVEPNFEIKP